MCVISSLLEHVSKEKSVGVAGRLFQHLTMQLQKNADFAERIRVTVICGPLQSI